MEAEQRSKLLQTLWRKGLTTREVGGFMVGQGKTRRMTGTKGGRKLGETFMKEKVKDSRKEEGKLRKERTILRESLEEVLDNQNRYRNVMTKLRKKVERIKKKIQIKNKKKIKKYQKERDKEELDEMASMKEELEEFAKLRVFNNIQITPEKPKTPSHSLQEDNTLRR